MATIAVHPDVTTTVHYKTIRIREVDIFYREAGRRRLPFYCSYTASRHRRSCSGT